MNRRAAFTFIIITLIIDAMGIGLIIPVMPALLADITGGTIGTAAVWGTLLSTIFALVQFLIGPFIGSLSDRYGRRPVLLISMAVLAIDYAIYGIAGTLLMLIILRVVAGIASATQSTATAFISDISAPEEKSANFGILGAAFGVGFVLGPLVAAGLIGLGFDFRAPFFAASALALVNLILGYFVLPETVTDELRRPLDLARANPIGAISQIRKHAGMARYLLLFFLYDFAFFVYPAIWAYFGYERFGWSEGMVSLSLALFGISIVFVQGYLIRIIIPMWGEKKTLLFGFIFNLIVFIILGFIKSGTLALLFTPLTAMGAVVVPTLQGLISKMGSDNQQGEVQGIISSVRSLAVISSPLILGWVFYWATLEDGFFYLPGAPFLLSACFVFACLVIFLARPKGSLSKVP